MKALTWIGLVLGIGGAAAAVAGARSRARTGKPSGAVYESAATRILILGGGFAGLTTARALARKVGHVPGVSIRLVDQGDSLTFWPMVPEVVPGTIEAPHVLHSLREELIPLGVEFVRAKVIGGDLDLGHIQTCAGEMIFDKLVVALGWETAFFDTPGAAEHCLTLHSLADAVAIRSRVIDRFEAAGGGSRDDLQFIVVGGGSSGVEVAAGMARLVDLLLPQYPHVAAADVHLTIVQAKNDLLPHMEKPLRQAAASRLHQDRIHLRTDSRVKAVDAKGVVLSSGERLDAGTVIWAAGVQPNSVARKVRGLSLDSHGRVDVDECLRVAGHPGIYALGDVAAVRSGRDAVAPTAQAAVQEAAVAAGNIAAEVTGGSPRPFQYHNMGHLVELGGSFAVSQVMGARLSGMAGHLLWRGVYLYKLGDWRDRLHVVSDWLINWALPPSVPRVRVQ